MSTHENNNDPAAQAAAIAAGASATSHVALAAAQGNESADPANTILGLSTRQVVSVVGMLASAAANAFAPGVTVVGMTVAQLTKLAVGVAEAVPSAVEAFEQIKAAASSTEPPTQAQWDAWNAAADQAHQELQEAAAAVR